MQYKNQGPVVPGEIEDEALIKCFISPVLRPSILEPSRLFPSFLFFNMQGSASPSPLSFKNYSSRDLKIREKLNLTVAAAAREVFVGDELPVLQMQLDVLAALLL